MGISASLSGIRKLLQAVKRRLLLIEEERAQAEGTALEKWGKGLQELAKADTITIENLAALVELLKEAGLSDEQIGNLIEREGDRVLRMMADVETLRARIRDGSILSADVEDEPARKPPVPGRRRDP
jgi:hypothetical protein